MEYSFSYLFLTLLENKKYQSKNLFFQRKTKFIFTLIYCVSLYL
ncbi:hypothetical protein HMPREF1145_1230 [Oribacterium parvum ACB8]|nr:hypothetical protein HMPREF1145_1230 [Oribacterium parvum ACB8]